MTDYIIFTLVFWVAFGQITYWLNRTSRPKFFFDMEEHYFLATIAWIGGMIWLI